MTTNTPDNAQNRDEIEAVPSSDDLAVLTLDPEDMQHMRRRLTSLDPFACVTCKRIADALDRALGANP